MKTIIKITISLLFVQLLSTATFAQAPDKMSYQAVIRDADNNLLSNTPLGMQISILLDSDIGTPVYIETHTPTSNTNGLVSLEIGNGTPVSGDFSNIDWSAGTYYIKTETDPNGGTDYSISGTSQLLSVPYALYAKTVENTDDADADPANEIQELQISGNILSLSDDPSSTTIDLASFSGENQALSVTSETTTSVDLALTGSPSISFSIEDSDADATNEIQTLSKSGNTVSLSNGGGSFTDAVNDADANATNEIQDISLVGNELSISDGSTVDLSTISNGSWSTSGNAGTDATTDFIGTSDYHSLIFKVNNVTSGYIGLVNDQNLAFGLNSNPDFQGHHNTSFGNYTLNSNDTGKENVAIGNSALRRNTTGIWNTAVGTYGLANNTTGSFNTAVGFKSLNANTIGLKNTAIGYNSLEENISGKNNTATGYYSLNNNTIGESNTANGFTSLQSNTSGSYNTAIGLGSMAVNTIGEYNTAIGYISLSSNSTGFYNVAVGSYALDDNTIASNNTALGYSSLQHNTLGSYNVASGLNALRENKTGSSNIAVGADALRANTTGTQNVAIGDLAGTSGNFSNRIAIGNNVQNTASNQVRIGNESITSIGGYANWSNVSDRRFKKNIRENVEGLSFILKLRPVTYNLDLEAINNAIPSADKNRSTVINSEKSNTIQTGFIAQEVEESAQSLGYDFSGVDAPKNENDFYGLRYAEFVVPLVKATQEQQVLIEKQQDLTQEQQALIEEQQIKLLNQQNEIDELRLLVNQLLKD